ncbi:DNA repair protein RadA [bacterium]|nr:DNA repair protein RadA [bacterium]
MAKINSRFVCNSCGFVANRWLGKCTECSAWNSFNEEKQIFTETKTPKSLQLQQESKAVSITEISLAEEKRTTTGFSELDRVLGGGIVNGSLILVGGEPGIGKSTLTLQVATNLAKNGKKILYTSGEESLKQIRMRADRLTKISENLYLQAETNLASVLEEAKRINPELLVVDSIQTAFIPLFESIPGSITQIRECTANLMRFAKTSGIPVVIIGHVNKEGSIAGPKILEHIVDTVLYFEGDSHQTFKIIRAVKNRFGSTNEIGIFEMFEEGLKEVTNPSQIFLENRTEASGSVITCSIEGTRPLLIEVQALVSPTNYGYPQRNSTGIDPKRLAMILAVLEKRLGYKLGANDVFLNIAGGIKVNEPAIDLGVAVAIASSYQDLGVRKNTLAIGEVGLNGEIRTVTQMEKRIFEAEKMGFLRVVIPDKTQLSFSKKKNIEIVRVARIREALKETLV